MKQSTKVVMLPTKDKTRIVLNHGVLKYFKVNPIGVTKDTIPQHIYITVSQDVEPIKEGNWFINMEQLIPDKFGNGIYQHHLKNYNVNKPYLRKIIATDDPKLIIDVSSKAQKESYIKEWTILPQVQQSFLKEFVANPNGKWEVEYDDINPSLFVNQDNTVNITSVEEKMYSKKEVKSLINEFYKDFCEGTGLEDLKDNWIKENL
jgi:hypothetical protein